MDRKFLEFWGNALLNAAKGQEQVENLNRMARDGFKTFEQQLSLFQKLYGLDKKPDPTPPRMRRCGQRPLRISRSPTRNSSVSWGWCRGKTTKRFPRNTRP